MFQFFRGRFNRKENGQEWIPSNHSWVKVDKKWLVTGLSLAYANEVLDGPVAEFYPDEQLKKLSRYRDGRASTVHNALELELGVPRARVVGDGVLCSFVDGIEEVHLVFEDDAQYIREPADWEQWINKWIIQICGGERVTVLSQ